MDEVAMEGQGDQLQDCNLQTDQHKVKATHHDALEFPNGKIVLLTTLEEGQQATVLQLPTSAAAAGALQQRLTSSAVAETLSTGSLIASC